MIICFAGGHARGAAVCIGNLAHEGGIGKQINDRVFNREIRGIYASKWGICQSQEPTPLQGMTAKGLKKAGKARNKPKIKEFQDNSAIPPTRPKS